MRFDLSSLTPYKQKSPNSAKAESGLSNYLDNNDTVSKGFIWFHSKNETIMQKVKLSFGTETMLISLSNRNLSIRINNQKYCIQQMQHSDLCVTH